MFLPHIGLLWYLDSRDFVKRKIVDQLRINKYTALYIKTEEKMYIYMNNKRIKR